MCLLCFRFSLLLLFLFFVLTFCCSLVVGFVFVFCFDVVVCFLLGGGAPCFSNWGAGAKTRSGTSSGATIGPPRLLGGLSWGWCSLCVETAHPWGQFKRFEHLFFVFYFMYFCVCFICVTK